jgi:hypothetical protein
VFNGFVNVFGATVDRFGSLTSGTINQNSYTLTGPITVFLCDGFVSERSTGSCHRVRGLRNQRHHPLYRRSRKAGELPQYSRLHLT